jgi:hypothetical protein
MYFVNIRFDVLPAFSINEPNFRSVEMLPLPIFSYIPFIRKVWFNTPPQTYLPQICALCGGEAHCLLR